MRPPWPSHVTSLVHEPYSACIMSLQCIYALLIALSPYPHSRFSWSGAKGGWQGWRGKVCMAADVPVPRPITRSDKQSLQERRQLFARQLEHGSRFRCKWHNLGEECVRTDIQMIKYCIDNSCLYCWSSRNWYRTNSSMTKLCCYFLVRRLKIAIDFAWFNATNVVANRRICAKITMVRLNEAVRGCIICLD
jgi:hypothetical protein